MHQKNLPVKKTCKVFCFVVGTWVWVVHWCLLRVRMKCCYVLCTLQLLAEALWTVDTQKNQQTITNVVAKRAVGLYCSWITRSSGVSQAYFHNVLGERKCNWFRMSKNWNIYWWKDQRMKRLVLFVFFHWLIITE